MASDDNESIEQKQKKGRSKIIIIIVAVVALIILAAAGFFVYKAFISAPATSGQTAAAPAEGMGDMTPAAPVSSAEPGVMYDLPTFVVNLANPSGSKYLKMAMSVEMSPRDKKLPAELDLKLPKIKDIIITVLSSKTLEEITTPQGKVSLKHELIRRINGILTGGKLTDLYITEFVVQG